MPSSYFAKRETDLDPVLFSGDRMVEDIRHDLLHMVDMTLGSHFSHPDIWSSPYLAGSGASYQWSAIREPADLDVLVAIDDIRFRESNPDYRGFSSHDISAELNDVFHSELMPHTVNWKGYELTFYALDTDNILDLRPYAAYDIRGDQWVVHPTREGRTVPAQWEEDARGLRAAALAMFQWYSKSIQEVNYAPNDAVRRNSEQALMMVLDQADELYRTLHSMRGRSFTASGGGYGDRNNFLWQASKRDGWLSPIKELHIHRRNIRSDNDVSTYGVELPGVDVLMRRAMASYGSRQTT